MQVVSDAFHRVFAGGVVKVASQAKISFTKQRSQAVNWFTLDRSVLGGDDLLATAENNPTQLWDAYDYQDVSQKLIEMVVNRSVEFPYNVQASVADVTLSNLDGYFSFSPVQINSGNSPIAQYILPKRPLRLYVGTDNEKVPMFVGMLQKIPQYDEAGTANWSALDFLSEIAETDLRATLKMRDVTTDVVIAKILGQYGMTSQQYQLSRGQNLLPFVLFKKGENTGNILRKLVQAENGALWLDEQGIVRFTTRSGVLDKQPVMRLTAGKIVEISNSQTGAIINRVKIKSEVRQVQANQAVFSMINDDLANDEWRVKQNSRKVVWLKLDDPVYTMTNLVLNGGANQSKLQAKFQDGRVVNNSVVLKGELLQDSYKLTITNQNNAPVTVTNVELWGEPAKVVDVIEYEAKNQASIDKYGDLPLIIEDNNYFGNYRNCDLLAVDVLKKYSEYAPTLEVEILPNPALQLGDVVAVDYNNLGDHMITGIELAIGGNDIIKMRLKLKKHTVVSSFILNKSILDGEDILA